MDCKNKILFFILFAFKEFLSSQSSPASIFQYDITKVVDQWFNKLFKIDPNISKLRKAFSAAEHYNLAEVEYNLKRQIEPFDKKMLFVDVHFYQHWIDVNETSKVSQITWNMPQNKICALFYNLRVTVRAKLRAKLNETGNRLFTTLNFRNFILCGTSSSLTKNRSIEYDFSYSNYFLKNYGYGRDIQWSGEEGGSVAIKTEEITQDTESALIALLRENIKRNKNFYQAFNILFSDYTQINQEVISTRPDIYEEPKYYYLIPKIPFHRFTLNIVIHGLLNIESLKIYTVPDIFTRSLLIKHLEGNLVLDYGSRQEGAPAPMELTFRIEYLSISTKHKISCAHIEAKYYGFNSTKGPLHYRHSAFLMQRIESALVSAIMPTKGVWKLCDIESPIDEPKSIASGSKPDWETIKETYKDWIPFPDDEIVKIKITK